MQLFSLFESHHRFAKFALECSKWSLYLLLFLLPIFFLPWTLDILEINKQTLFILLTSVSLLAWLGAMVSAKRILFHFHISLIFLPLLFLSALISTFFNKTGFLSLIGHASQEYTSVLTLFFGCMFFFLILNLAKEEGFLQKSLYALFASSILVALIGLSSFLGWFFLPFDFARAQTFNTIGTVNSLGIFLGLMLILANSFWVFQKKRPEMLLALLTLLSLLVLFMIDYWLIWMIVLIGFSALFLMGFLYAHELISTRRFLLPITSFVLALLFLMVPSPFSASLPTEIAPNHKASMIILEHVWKETSFFFGSGPGTYVYDFARFHPLDINSTPFWNTRFDRASSFFLTVATTLGVFGIFSLLGLFLFLSISFIRFLRNNKKESLQPILFLPVFLGLVVTFFSYGNNMTLQVLFFFLVAAMASALTHSVFHHDLEKRRHAHPLIAIAFMVVSLGIITIIFLSGFRYAAEIAFAKGVRLERSGASSKEVVSLLSTAASVNQYEDIYYRTLAQVLLRQVHEELEGNTASSQNQSLYLQELIASAINASARATDLAPHNVLHWLARGQVYEEVMSFIPGSDVFALEAFAQARKREPLNPLYPLEMGRVYFQKAIQMRSVSSPDTDTLFSQAQTAFEQAIALKSDYAPAHYQLVLLFEEQGRLDEAIGKMESLAKYNPTDTQVWFELGLLYLHRNASTDLDRAQFAFEQSLILTPSYANALWFLAYVHEQKGNRDLAIHLVEKVLALNPENETVKQRLEQLKQGKTKSEQPMLLENSLDSLTGSDIND